MSHHEDSSSKQGWFVLLCAGLFYLYEYILRVSPSVITHELMSHYQLGSAGVGLLVSYYYMAYVPLQIPCGYILDRFGLRHVITASALLCTIGSFIFGCADSFMWAKIGRFLMGAGSACAYVSCMKAGAEWFKPSKFALISGLTLMMGTLGATFGAHPFAILVDSFGVKNAMMIMSYSGIAMTILAYAVIRDRKKIIGHDESPPFFESLKIIVKNPKNWILGFYGLLMYVGIAGFAELWAIPYLMKKMMLTKTVAASLAIIFFLGVALGSPLIAQYVEKHHDRILSMSFLGLTGAIVFGIILYLPITNIYLVGFLLLITGALCGGHVLCFVAAKEHTPPQLNGTVLSFINALVMMSGLIFQPLIGCVLDRFWTGALLLDKTYDYTIETYTYALSTVFLAYLCAAFLILILKTKRFSKND